MKFDIVVDEANLDESPHLPGIYKPTDRVHNSDAGPDIMEEAKLPADRLLAEQFGLYHDPADDLRRELFATVPRSRACASASPRWTVGSRRCRPVPTRTRSAPSSTIVAALGPSSR